MIDFACKQFDIETIIKCGLGLTRAEYHVMEFFIKNSKEYESQEIANKLDLNLSTVQKALKKLYEKDIVVRHQANLSNGAGPSPLPLALS